MIIDELPEKLAKEMKMDIAIGLRKILMVSMALVTVLLPVQLYLKFSITDAAQVITMLLTMLVWVYVVVLLFRSFQKENPILCYNGFILLALAMQIR